MAPATCRIRSRRWWNGKFVTLRILTRWASTPRDWTGVSMIRTAAGRVGACGRPMRAAPYHIEGGKGTTSKVVKFQLRPDPLAR